MLSSFSAILMDGFSLGPLHLFSTKWPLGGYWLAA